MEKCEICNKPQPQVAMFFDRSNIFLSIVVESLLVSISAKTFSILIIGVRGEGI